MEKTMIKNNPLTFYVRTLLSMLLGLILRVITFAPLVCLFVFPADSALRYLALLCPLMLIFLLLPLRYSMAEALVQSPKVHRFSFDTALSLSNYRKKLAESLLHALNVIKWGIPLFLMLGYCLYCYREVDLATLLKVIISMGEGLTNIGTSIANYFITLLGSIDVLQSSGGIAEGILLIAAVLGLGVVIWMYGALRNSANRYCWVLAMRQACSPRQKTRHCMRGRGFAQLGQGLLNLLLWIPFVLVIASLLKGVLSDASIQLMMMLTQQKLPALDTTSALLPLLLAFTFLYLPLLPIRRYITLTFAMSGEVYIYTSKQRKQKGDTHDVQAPADSIQTASAPALITAVDDAEGATEHEQNAAPEQLMTPVLEAEPEMVFEPSYAPVSESVFDATLQEEDTEITELEASAEDEPKAGTSTFTVAQ